jgi:hypothetical protein
MVEFSVKKFYDALKGRFIREIKENDIVHEAVPFDSHSAGTLTFYVCSSTEEVYIYGFGVSAATGGIEVGLTVGTSTLVPTVLGAAGETHILSSKPIYKAPASSTISIYQSTAATTAAWFFGVREPIFEKVETT